jgi:RNA polymerase sigma-70 factor (ECF subfamily)
MKEELELIQRAQSGETEAFGKLYDTYVSKIYRFILLKVTRRADAEDLTHHVFLSAWQNIRSYRFQGNPFSSWLYKIAHNAVIDFYRTQKPHVDIELVSEDSFSHLPDLEQELDRGAELIQVRHALTQLKQEDQSVLIMKFIDDLSNKEIAETLQKTEGAVRVMQHRALKQLKKIIDESGNTQTIRTA